jgi:hypothetical protein
MKKILVAVMLAALITALIVMPAAAEGDVTDVVTEPVTDVTTEAVTDDENITEETTEAISDTVTEETTTEGVDGAIVPQDYLTRMIEGAKNWVMENPDIIGTMAAAAGVLVSSILTAASSKKSRKRLELKSSEMESKAILLNNNAVELVETAKTTVETGRVTVAEAVMRMISGVTEVGRNIAAELKANRMETRANSVLMVEMLKDARLPEKRKDEIIALYNKERSGGEVEADDAADEA